MAQLKSHEGYYLWKYVPSIAAAVIFILLFTVLLGAHMWRMIRRRSWFCVPFTIGVLLEFIGYCARASAHNKTDKIMPYVIQNMYILIAPALFAASIYMTLGRLMRSVHAEHLSFIPVNWLTRLFVIGDVLSFIIQGGSAPLMFIGDGKYAKLGNGMVIAGLFVQIVMFGLFGATSVLFHLRIRDRPTNEYLANHSSWLRTMRMLYYLSGLIMVRSIFRVAEYIQGQEGYLLGHEWTIYVFDSVPMVVVAVLFYVWYPSDLRAGNRIVSLETASELTGLRK